MVNLSPRQAREQNHEPVSAECVLRVGTSGYSYTEWLEAGFYPPGTRASAMLPFYAQTFSITELNHTWYQMPKADMIERQRQQTPSAFLFAAKLCRTLTHEIDPALWKKHAAAFRDGISPLLQSRQLAAVLVQLPSSFDRSLPHRKYLSALFDELAGLPLAVEFRHDTWLADAVFAELAKRRITLVAVDLPRLPGLLPPVDVVTNPRLFYIRFHGRNARGWRSGHMQLQFDYDYVDAELWEWVERIAKMSQGASAGVMFFNNHVHAHAIKNARRLMGLLNQYGLKAK